MEIRVATEQDITALAALERICFPQDAWGETSLSTYVTDNDCPTAVAVGDDGAVMGYITGRMIPPEAELYRVCVHPGARGEGCGKHLTRFFHHLLRAGGCDTCYLEVRASNTPARALYRSLGYTEEGIRKNYYHAPREDAVTEVIKLEE